MHHSSTATGHPSERASGLIHLVGSALSLLALVVLVLAAVRGGRPWQVLSFSTFGVSLVLLYTSSTLYHLLPHPSRAKRVFRRIDRSMIYVLIAGTYTPITITALGNGWGWSMFAVVWSFAATGIALTAAGVKMPGSLSTLLYLGMGWLALLALPQLITVLSLSGVQWLVLGGILYTLGVIVYSLEHRIRAPAWLETHAVYHLFVLAGSISHFFAVLWFV